MLCASAWLARSMLGYCGDIDREETSEGTKASVKGPGRSPDGNEPDPEGRSIFGPIYFYPPPRSRILEFSLGGNEDKLLGNCRTQSRYLQVTRVIALQCSKNQLSDTTVTETLVIQAFPRCAAAP